MGRILERAKPGDWTIGQPTRFELLVNLNTAPAPGTRISWSVLPADEVIGRV